VATPGVLQSQDFKSYGLFTGLTFRETGWNSPDTFSSYYHDKAYINSITVGAFGEFFSYKYNSTICHLTLKLREFQFEYDLGSVSETVKNRLLYVDVSVAEKLKFDFKRWSTYVFGGVRADLVFSKSIQKDFQNVFEDSKPILLGTTLGVGFGKIFSGFFRLSFDFYYNYDLTKMNNTGRGEVQLKSFGFRIGIGPVNPASK